LPGGHLVRRGPRPQRGDPLVAAHPVDPHEQFVVEHDRLHPEPAPGAVLHRRLAHRLVERVAGDADQPRGGGRAVTTELARPDQPRDEGPRGEVRRQLRITQAAEE
jgi:hypothetical protein